MNEKLKPGLRGQSEFVVTEERLANSVGSGLVSVLATVMMIAGMEETAVATVQPALDKGYTTVGTHVDVSHEAATPLGMKVRFTAELLEVSANGKGLTFHVEAHDENGLIGRGTHRRVVVHKERFENRTRSKKA